MKVILEKPLVTEKSSTLMENNKFTFIVNSSVNKIEIATYIEKEYEVKVKSINILKKKSKKRRRGRVVGSTSEKKKAIVTIDEKSNLDKIKKVF